MNMQKPQVTVKEVTRMTDALENDAVEEPEAAVSRVIPQGWTGVRSTDHQATRG